MSLKNEEVFGWISIQLKKCFSNKSSEILKHLEYLKKSKNPVHKVFLDIFKKSKTSLSFDTDNLNINNLFNIIYSISIKNQNNVVSILDNFDFDPECKALVLYTVDFDMEEHEKETIYLDSIAFEVNAKNTSFYLDQHRLDAIDNFFSMVCERLNREREFNDGNIYEQVETSVFSEEDEPSDFFDYSPFRIYYEDEALRLEDEERIGKLNAVKLLEEEKNLSGSSDISSKTRKSKSKEKKKKAEAKKLKKEQEKREKEQEKEQEKREKERTEIEEQERKETEKKELEEKERLIALQKEDEELAKELQAYEESGYQDSQKDILGRLFDFLNVSDGPEPSDESEPTSQKKMKDEKEDELEDEKEDELEDELEDEKEDEKEELEDEKDELEDEKEELEELKHSDILEFSKKIKDIYENSFEVINITFKEETFFFKVLKGSYVFETLKKSDEKSIKELINMSKNDPELFAKKCTS